MQTWIAGSSSGKKYLTAEGYTRWASSAIVFDTEEEAWAALFGDRPRIGEAVVFKLMGGRPEMKSCKLRGRALQNLLNLPHLEMAPPQSAIDSIRWHPHNRIIFS